MSGDIPRRTPNANTPGPQEILVAPGCEGKTSSATDSFRCARLLAVAVQHLPQLALQPFQAGVHLIGVRPVRGLQARPLREVVAGRLALRPGLLLVARQPQEILVAGVL